MQLKKLDTGNIILLCILQFIINSRWRGQSAEEHHDHMIHVAYRGMLEVISGGRALPRKALRGLKYGSIQEYATTVASNLNGK